MRYQYLLGAAAAALAIPAAASAQETTASIRGSVTASGTPVAGATVVATDVASNTKAQTTTDANGSFELPGLRAGGPYTVDITSPQGNKTVTDIYTVVQQAFTLPVELAADATVDAGGTGKDIVVTASRIRGAGTSSGGPVTVLTQADVSKVASVNRDIRDIERRDPFATLDLSNSRAVSFAGVNPRFNRFTINGVQVGDTFGLNPDASPTGRGPIPYDAIGQVSVSIAPYDFRQGGFQGGAIDTVLLSGTNEFHGTGFYSQSRDELQGKKIGSFGPNSIPAIVIPNYKSETFGATLRGPLIADKLFFMVSAERNTDPRPVTPNSLSQVPNLSAATLAAVTGPAQTLYGYNPGGIVALSQNKDEKIVGRIDWNITTGQRLTLSYVNAFDQSDSIQNSSTSTSAPSLGLESDAYRLTELLRAGIVQLNSDWTDNFSTEGRFIYRSTKRGQDPLDGRGFAQFGVCTDAASVGSNTACSTAVPRVFYGPDISRQTNTLFFDTWAGSFLTRLRMNNHELKLLAEFSENRTSNNFLQYSAGGYYFDSLAGYNAKNADQLTYAATLNGSPNGASAEFHYDQWTFGVQDDWRVDDKLTVTYGVRYDLFGMRNAPTLNPFFQQRYNFPNTQTYKGIDNFQPRMSFNYKATPELRFKGGFGVFGGGSPDIYLSNSFSNTILSNRVTFTRAPITVANPAGCTANAGTPTAAVCAAALNNVNGTTINPVVTQYATSNTASLASSSTGALDPNFKQPSVYKATLSGDYTFMGVNFGADYIFTRTKEALYFKDIRSIVVGTLPDGRPRYSSATTFADTNFDILLTNTTKGRAHVADVRFNKTFDWGLSLGGSYTYQNVKDVAAATSSTITSNYGNQAMGDPNIAAYGTSNDQTKWQFKYSLGYDHAFFGDYRTVFQLFGETRAGRPYSFTMQDNTGTRSTVFGTASNNDRYLLYVPASTTDPLIVYGATTTTVNGVTTTQSAADAQTFLDNLINTSALKNYRGQIAPKNIARSRAFTRIDLHLEQEIPTFIGKSRISLFGDIENLPNLLNKDWGGLRQLGFPYTGSVVNVQCLSAASATPLTGAIGSATNPTAGCARYLYTAARDVSEKGITLNQSLYLIRVGARFSF